MTLDELIKLIRDKLNPVIEQKQPAKTEIEINTSQGGIGECYIRYKAKLTDKRSVWKAITK